MSAASTVDPVSPTNSSPPVTVPTPPAIAQSTEHQKNVTVKPGRGRKAANPRPQAELEWMETRLPEFQKTHNSSVRSTLLDKIRKDFELKFGEIGANIEGGNKTIEVRAFRTWFNNRYTHGNPFKQTNTSSTAEKNIFDATPLKEITGRHLFEQSIRSELNDEVNEAREKDNIPHTKHPSMYQARLKQHWEALSSAEKHDYELQAIKESEEMQRGDEFENQGRLEVTMSHFLSSLTTTDSPYTIGNSAIYVLVAYRNRVDEVTYEEDIQEETEGAIELESGGLLSQSSLVDELT